MDRPCVPQGVTERRCAVRLVSRDSTGGVGRDSLAFVAFRPLPDRGYLLAKPLGLLLVATIAWLLASYGLMGFSFASVIVAMLATAGLSALAWWRYGHEIAGYLKQRWRMVLGFEALFLIAFLAFLAVRLAIPICGTHGEAAKSRWTSRTSTPLRVRRSCPPTTRGSPVAFSTTTTTASS